MLAVTIPPAIILPALHLEYDDLLVTRVPDDFRRYLDTAQVRFADPQIFAIRIKKHVITLYSTSHFDIKKRNLDIIFRFHCKLFASQINDCVHYS